MPDAKDFGFLVDAPEIRSLIFETRRLTEEIDDTDGSRRGAAPGIREVACGE